MDAAKDAFPKGSPEEVQRLHQKVFEFYSKIWDVPDEEALIKIFTQVLKDLFPGKYFYIRTVDPITFEVRNTKVEGPLRPEAADWLTIVEKEVKGVDIPEAAIRLGRVLLVESYSMVFEGTQDGGCLPLSANGKFYGLLNVEYPEQTGEWALQRTILEPLVGQLAKGIRNLKQLREKELLKNFVSQLVESANELVVVVNRNLEVRVYNKAIQELTGFIQNEVMGSDFISLFQDPDGERIKAALLQAFRGESTENLEIRILSRLRVPVRIVFQVVPVLDNDGKVVNALAIGQDLTRIKDLEHKVIQTEKLANLGQIAAGVAHELNNPLTSISVYARYLYQKFQEEGVDPLDIQRLSRIIEGADRIQSFTKALTSYSRPSSEEMEKVSLNMIVEEAISFCEYIMRKMEVDINTRLSANLPQIWAISSQLQQVLINLITNACQSMVGIGRAGLLILDTRLIPPDCVVLTVQDNGSGIPEDDLAKIFEPFFSTKSEGKGTGLGLSIVKEIIENHRGRIEVQSAMGRGTSFMVEFPVAGQTSPPSEGPENS